jgi:HSP20 family protein
MATATQVRPVDRQVEETRSAERRRIRPYADIWQDDNAVHVTIEMPGVDQDGLDVRIEENRLIVHGHREARSPEHRYVLAERRDADFYTAFTIDDSVDREKVDARLERGMLHITLHIKESVKPRKIEVQAG